MRPRSFLALLLVTLLAVAGAAVVLLERAPATAAGGDRRPAFPDLSARAAEIARLTVTTGSGRIELARADDGRWVAPERGGYPADQATVDTLLQGLAALTLFEPRTADPARLPRLWLEELGPEARSLRLTVAAADGSALVDAFFGRRSNDPLGEAEGGTYLRFAGDPQAWLAAGRVAVPAELTDFLDLGIVSLPDDTIRRIEVRHPDGTHLLAERARGEPQLLLTAGLPEGGGADPAKLARLASLVDGLNFEDVRPAGEVAFPADPIVTVVTSFDGIELTFELALLGSEPWLRVAAALAAEHTENPEHLPGIEAFIAAVNARTAGWAYRIGAGSWRRLATQPADLAAAD